MSFKGQYLRINNTALGGAFKAGPKSNMGQSIIANISNITSATNDRVLFGCFTDDKDKYWLHLDRNGKINAEVTSNYDGQSFSTTASKDNIDFDVQHSFGMFITQGAEKSFGMLDGVPVHTNTIYFVNNANILNLGTWKSVGSAESRNKFLTNARVSYVAIFPDDEELSLEDFKTWSLYEMTRAETATNVTTATTLNLPDDAVLKGGKGVGVNLLGGTFKVKGKTEAHALFVQEDSVLEFGDSASLTLAGPVYIATNRTLTLSLASGASSAAIRSPHFAADDGQIVNPQGITVGPPGVELKKPTLETVRVDGEDVKPMQIVDGSVVFGVKTTPDLCYAVVASSDIDEIASSTTPTTTPFIATNEGAKITIPMTDSPLMFYKIIVAPSAEAMGSSE